MTYRLPVYPADALHGGHPALLVDVELQSRLHEPDGIREGAGHEASARSRTHVDDGRVGREDAVPELLRLAVHTEVHGPRGGHADQVRAQA